MLSPRGMEQVGRPHNVLSTFSCIFPNVSLHRWTYLLVDCASTTSVSCASLSRRNNAESENLGTAISLAGTFVCELSCNPPLETSPPNSDFGQARHGDCLLRVGSIRPGDCRRVVDGPASVSDFAAAQELESHTNFAKNCGSAPRVNSRDHQRADLSDDVFCSLRAAGATGVPCVERERGALFCCQRRAFFSRLPFAVSV